MRRGIFIKFIFFVLAFNCIAFSNQDIGRESINFLKLDDNTNKQLRKVSSVAYSSYHSLLFSHALIDHCINKNIEGDFVECGVAAGVHIAAMALSCQKNMVYRKIHLFDSFLGLPLAGPKDEHQPGYGKCIHDVNGDLNSLLIPSSSIYSNVKGDSVSFSALTVMKNLRNWGIDPARLVYHKGWFQKTLPIQEIDRIAVLKIDGALYESTKVCLEYLYPKVVKGGYVVFSNILSKGCFKALSEYLETNNLNPDILTVSKDSGLVYWKIL